MKNSENLFLLTVALLSTLLQSCSYDGRLTEKFVKRINAREVGSASKYIYPGDHANLYFFNAEVLSRTPNLFLKVKEKNNLAYKGELGVEVIIECKNVSPFFVNYMNNLHKLDYNNCIVDTFFIKETEDGDKLTFNWSTIKGENLFLANIKNDGKAPTTLPIRAGKGTHYNEIAKLEKGSKVVVDEYSDDPNWFKCFLIDYQCHIIQGYIQKNPNLVKNSLFFSLDIFDSLSLLVALGVIALITLPVILLFNIVDALFNIPVVGLLIAIALVLAVIYVAYQLLENILFELFLFNLPY